VQHSRGVKVRLEAQSSKAKSSGLLVRIRAQVSLREVCAQAWCNS